MAAMPGARICAFGHMGDGNIHYNISQPIGADKDAFIARWREMNEIVHGIVLAHGGSISAEHGIGQLKRDELAAIRPAIEIDLMRRIKRAFDPANIMNPGKVISFKAGRLRRSAPALRPAGTAGQDRECRRRGGVVLQVVHGREALDQLIDLVGILQVTETDVVLQQLGLLVDIHA